MENVAWLIENGANVNATDRSGGTVLRHSLVCRDQELVDYLLEVGALPDEKTYESAECAPLPRAAERSVRRLLIGGDARTAGGAPSTWRSGRRR
jgi:hypothetical protein